MRDLILSLYHVGSGYQTQVMGLGSKCLSLWSHLTYPKRIICHYTNHNRGLVSWSFMVLSRTNGTAQPQNPFKLTEPGIYRAQQNQNSSETPNQSPKWLRKT